MHITGHKRLGIRQSRSGPTMHTGCHIGATPQGQGKRRARGQGAKATEGPVQGSRHRPVAQTVCCDRQRPKLSWARPTGL
ncbi:hypothetical protein V6N12_009437 [Hibiscus sabdariffa]|uniref:Uncharacterized protein n=1 Tax=Hibiscus sabdariffa TaxID=183260 RepID=A0ABR2E9L5_9ROSI